MLGDNLMGMPIYEDSFLGNYKQVRFPKSKKKRIRRKWAKQRRYYAFVPDPNVYVVGKKVLGHPATIAKLTLAIDEVKKKVVRDEKPPKPAGWDTVTRMMEILEDMFIKKMDEDIWTSILQPMPLQINDAFDRPAYSFMRYDAFPVLPSRQLLLSAT